MKFSGRLILILILFITFSSSAFALNVSFMTTDIQGDAGIPVTISVMVTNNSEPVNNTLVNFTTDFGVLNSSSAYSDSSGIAEVIINSTITGTAHINASSGSVYDLTNVTFLPLEIASIVVETDHAVNTAGNVTNITFYPKDIFGNINSSEDISLKVTINDVLGNTIPDNEILLSVGNIAFLDVNRMDSNIFYTTGPDDRAILTLNSTIAGHITINSSVGPVSNITHIEIISGSPALLKTVYNDDYTVNTSSSFYVSVFDRYENPVENANITFSVTPPANTVYNSPVTYNSASFNIYNGLTGSNGQLSNVFRTDKRAGGNIIGISVVNTSLQHNITITGLADVVDSFFLAYTPEVAIANNIDYYTVSTSPVDQFLNPIIPLTTPIKEQVRFITGDGDLLLVPLNSQGRANIVVGPTPYVESVSVTATYKNEFGYTSFTNSTVLNFTVDVLDSIDLYAVPNAVLDQAQNGNHNSTITVVALDQWGHAIPDTPVTLNNTNTTVGTLSVDDIGSTDLITTTTNSDGRLYATFTGNVSGNTTIVATSGNFSLLTNVTVKDEPFMSIIVNVNPSSVDSGSIVNVTTVISVEGELPIVRPAASAMLVLDRSGSMDPDYYAGAPIDVVLVLDRSGSMKFLGASPQQPMTDAKTAAKEFVDNLVSNAQAGVVSFSTASRIDQNLILMSSYDNHTLVNNAIDSIVADGSTAMGDGMADANSMLLNGRPGSKKVMVVLTDGVCNAGSDRQGKTAIEIAKENGITIYTIGLGTAEYIDEPLLQTIALETGGVYYNAPTSSELSDVYNSIAQEISDYDVSSAEYGTEGFTPYDYTFQDSLGAPASVDGVVLKFEGYDLDTTFNAGSHYGGSSAGECLIQINGNNFDLIPSSNTGINEEWDDYEYDISGYMRPGANTITFYDYYDYETGTDWNNRVRNVEVFWNGTKIQYYPDNMELDASGYTCSVSIIEPFETSFEINETISDLKVKLDWADSSSDMDIRLTSPSGKVYGKDYDTTGYYFDSREEVPIDVRSPVFDTYITSAEPSDDKSSETRLYITDNLGGVSDESAIFRWKLPEAPTHNARIESVKMYLYGVSNSEDASNNRYIQVYDVSTNFSNPTWSHSDSVNTWVSGDFSTSDYNSSHTVYSKYLTSSVENNAIEFDITDAQWGNDRLPEWGESCAIVLMGSGYNSGEYDRFASSETNPNDYQYDLNGRRPLVTVTYSLTRDASEYIWVSPLSYVHPDDDHVETGEWTLKVTNTGTADEDFAVSTYIDKLSASKLSSHAFMTSFDESNGDKAGLALYSFESLSLSDNQTSYLLDSGSWSGYFTPETNGYYTFDASWDDTSEMTFSLYEGADLLNSSVADTGIGQVSSSLYAGKTYLLDVSKAAYSGTDTLFTVNVSSSVLDTIMTAYYDGSEESGRGTPRVRTWDGSQWSMESSSNYIDAVPNIVALESSPVSSEIIMVTGDSQNDVNVQLWDGSSWSSVRELSDSLSSGIRRGFDVKYEQLSGDAVVVYMDVTTNAHVPQYRVWDGSSWSSEAQVNSVYAGAGTVQWVRLEAKPNSDEMVLVTLDNSWDVRAQVWDGNSWGDPTIIADRACVYSYQCFDVVYEQGTGNAMVVWADLTSNSVKSCVWNGNSWEPEETIYSFSDSVYWIKMAADPDSNDILLVAQDVVYDVYVASWDGSSWSSALKIEDRTYRNDVRTVDVAFEKSTGEGLVVWGTDDYVPKYRTWNRSSWSDEYQVSTTLNGYPRWVQLTPNPVSDEIFLMLSDGGNDLSIQKWDGSSWGSISQVEPSSLWNYKCFDIAFSINDIPPESTSVRWNEWTASVTSTLTNDSLSHLENAIDTITADGLTAIDEGMYVANNELSSVDGNSTIVLMTDGLDNAGYHSLLEEAYRAKDNDTVIYTVGFGNDESEVDPVLEEIATITGGEYYFAPNSSVLEDIFIGIALQITNFSASGTAMNIDIPYNYETPLSTVKVTYISGSSNSTTGNDTYFETPKAPPKGNAEPSITSLSGKTRLKWYLPNMGSGDKWGIWYQLSVSGAGYIPVIMPTSSVTYTDLSSEVININIPPSGGVSVGGSSASSSSFSLDSLDMVPERYVMLIDEPTNIDLTVWDTTGNMSNAYVHLYTDIGYFENKENPINKTVFGSDSVNFTSAVAGSAHITAYVYSVNPSMNNASDVLTAKDVLVVRPKGAITIT